MAAQQRRLLTAPTSKLGKADIIAVLRQEEAWTSLPFETRERLYNLLPGPLGSESSDPPDPDIHPLKSAYKPYIDEELRRWQQDLKDGREAKKWREEAMQAGQDRVDGKFDEWKDEERERYWGKTKVEKKVQEENGEAGGKEDESGDASVKNEDGEGDEIKDSQDESEV